MINEAGKYTVFSVDMGWMAIASTGRGVFASVLPQPSREKAETELFMRVPFKPILSHETFSFLINSLKAYFSGQADKLDCDIDWSWATPFQKKVLNVVRTIPTGSYLTYSEVAYLAGIPNGARAVGGALASNMVPIIIPCHRVIRKNGVLGGFTGASLDVKARLLCLEGVNLNKIPDVKKKQGT